MDSGKGNIETRSSSIKPGEKGSLENPLKTLNADDTIILSHSLSHDNNGTSVYFNWQGRIFSINDASILNLKKDLKWVEMDMNQL